MAGLSVGRIGRREKTIARARRQMKFLGGGRLVGAPA